MTATAASTRSSQLTREQDAAALIHQWVTYVGLIGSAYGQRFQVTAAYDGRVTLTREGEDRPTLSFVQLHSIQAAS
jgi:hypothetical protein